MLPSKRIEAAPNLAQVITRTTPRAHLPTVPSPAPRLPHAGLVIAQPLNGLQRSPLTASAVRYVLNTSTVVQSIKTVQDAVKSFK
jgi:hypothetical protein